MKTSRARPPLQAVLLADSFTLKFRPITLERPKVLLPLVNKPMIEYTLRWLESAGVEEAFVFCCAHSHQVKEYLDKAGWAGKSGPGSMAVMFIESGDALRVIHDRGVFAYKNSMLIALVEGLYECIKTAL